MRKLIIIIVLFIYVIPAVGIHVNLHYCGGKFSSISFDSEVAAKCSCGSKKMKKNCCEDKDIKIHVEDNQVTPPKIVVSFNYFSDFHSFTDYYIDNYFHDFPIIALESSVHHPPNKVKQPLYIFNQVFLI